MRTLKSVAGQLKEAKRFFLIILCPHELTKETNFTNKAPKCVPRVQPARLLSAKKMTSIEYFTILNY